jgi:anti-sigma factor RsiW
MECFEVDTKLIAYLDHSLEDEELQAFLKHLEKCPECREEVELFFTLMEGLKQMEEDEIQISDFHQAFEERRREQLKDVVMKKACRQITDRLVLLFVFFMVLMGFIYGLFHIYEYRTQYIAQKEYTYEQQISID